MLVGKAPDLSNSCFYFFLLIKIAHELGKKKTNPNAYDISLGKRRATNPHSFPGEVYAKKEK